MRPAHVKAVRELLIDPVGRAGVQQLRALTEHILECLDAGE